MLAKPFKGVDRILNEGAGSYLHGYPDDEAPKESPYYWWFQYIKRHSGYLKCCERGGTGKYAKLFRDWGDVRTDDFDDWFFEHGDSVFREPDTPDALAEITHPSELKDVDWNSVMVVACPIRIGTKLLSKRDIKAQFSDMVDRRFPVRPRGRPNFESAAKYRVNGYPNLRLLEEYLAAFILREEEPGLRLWQIGERLYWEGKFKSGKKSIHKAKDTDAIKRDKNRVMTVLVSRHLRIAREYIASSVEQSFPVRSLSKGD